MKINSPAFEPGNLERREIQAQFFAYLIRGYINALGRDRAMQLASNAIREDAMQIGRNMVWKYNGNTLAELLKVIREVWAEGAALEFEIQEQTGQILSFKVTRCQYAELYDRLGMKEYGFCLSCNRDEAFFQGFNPRMKLIRNQTIMQGAQTCDFRIILEQKEPDG
ncbi:MAG: L-2-amino-thiazoline-4-carboxylic acid hydrolase [Anaerolineales bacterium]